MSPSAGATIPELPESVLVKIPGLDYVDPPNGSAAALKTLSESAEHPELLDGAIIRGLQQGSTVYGYASVLRFSQTAGEGVAASAQRDMLEEFSRGKAERSKVAGQTVWQTEGSRGTNVAAILWAEGNDVIMLAAGSLDNARAMTAHWLAGG